MGDLGALLQGLGPGSPVAAGAGGHAHVTIQLVNASELFEVGPMCSSSLPSPALPTATLQDTEKGVKVYVFCPIAGACGPVEQWSGKVLAIAGKGHHPVSFISRLPLLLIPDHIRPVLVTITSSLNPGLASRANKCDDQTKDVLLQGLHKSLTPAFIEDLEECVEGLYEEDLAARTAAAGALSQLFKSVSNFEVKRLHQRPDAQVLHLILQTWNGCCMSSLDMVMRGFQIVGCFPEGHV